METIIKIYRGYIGIMPKGFARTAAEPMPRPCWKEGAAQENEEAGEIARMPCSRLTKGNALSNSSSDVWQRANNNSTARCQLLQLPASETLPQEELRPHDSLSITAPGQQRNMPESP